MFSLFTFFPGLIINLSKSKKQLLAQIFLQQKELEILKRLGGKFVPSQSRNTMLVFHSISWDGKDKKGSPVASGIYLYQLSAGTCTQVKKMSLLR